jgi:hypothetical protein
VLFAKKTSNGKADGRTFFDVGCSSCGVKTERRESEPKLSSLT